ncbi:18330_t:CDS:2 [Entrophospora sp. SA101]|nr:18330_t:CDS:2 [Entrophospora sp. SA101]
MLPCPGNNEVNDGRAWYSPNWTERGEFAFCEECYHRFIKKTPLSIHMRSDGEFEGCTCTCDFTSSVKKQWSLAVKKNDINIFNEHVKRTLKQYRINELKVLIDTETLRYSTLLAERQMHWNSSSIECCRDINNADPNVSSSSSFPTTTIKKTLESIKEKNAKAWNQLIIECIDEGELKCQLDYLMKLSMLPTQETYTAILKDQLEIGHVNCLLSICQHSKNFDIALETY